MTTDACVCSHQPSCHQSAGWMRGPSCPSPESSFRFHGRNQSGVWEVRLLGRLLVLLGALGLIAAVIWWRQFYQQVAAVIGANGSALPIECLFRSSGDCGLASGAASLLGGTPYSPFLLWLSGALVAVGLVMWGAGGGPSDRLLAEPKAAPLPAPETISPNPAARSNRSPSGWWLLTSATAAIAALVIGFAIWHQRPDEDGQPPSPATAQSSTSAAVGPAALPNEVGEPFDLKTTNPKALKAIQRIIPADLQSVEWVFELAGTSPPMKLVTVAGMPYLAGSVCRTHFCAGNTFVFLVAADGSRATALLKSEDLYSGKQIEFGSPLASDRATLDQLMSNF